MNEILIYPTYFPTLLQMATVVQAQKVVFEKEDNYQKQTYRNRCYIAHANGKLLLNVPVKHSKKQHHQKTKEVCVENDFPWQSHHWKSLESAYRTSPFFEFYEDDIHPLFTHPVSSIFEHNINIFETLSELMSIDVEITYSNEYHATPEQTDLRFLANAKKPHFDNFPHYTQVLEANHGFIPNLSVLDLLFNEGPNALTYLEQLDLSSLLK